MQCKHSHVSQYEQASQAGGGGFMNNATKATIDSMSYESMLRRWRMAPCGDPMFQGDTGDYYAKVMAKKQKTADHVATSKRIGWEK